MTKKIGVKGITCTLLATFLFLSVGPGLVMADVPGSVCFFGSPWVCEGTSACCVDLPSTKCCKNTGAPDLGYSANVSPALGGGGKSFIYGDWTCSSDSQSTSGSYCWLGHCLEKYNSGKWSYNVEPGSEKPCNETVSPDTLQYTFITEDRRRASWVLPMASLTEADSNGPLRDLPAEEQVIWFKSRGATLKVEDHQTTSVPDDNAYSPASGLTLPHPLDPCS